MVCACEAGYVAERVQIYNLARCCQKCPRTREKQAIEIALDHRFDVPRTSALPAVGDL